MFMLTQIDGVWVIVDPDGNIVSSHGAGPRPPDAAVDALISHSAAALTTAAADTGGVPFTIPWAIGDGVETADHRRFDDVDTRPLPLPLMLMTVNSYGHDGSVIAGRIDTAEKDAKGVTRLTGFYLDTDEGRLGAHLAATQAMDGISVDQSAPTVEYYEEWSEDGSELIKWLEVYPQSTIMGATQCPFPAFPEAHVVVDAALDPRAGEEAAATVPTPAAAAPSAGCGCSTTAGPSTVAASAAVDLALPPAAWFANPMLEVETALEITDEGRVYGHIATWDRCHTALESGTGRCLTPPRSESGYAYFLTGQLVTADGERVNVGPLNVGGDHAGLELDARRATAHYADATTAFADVTIGEDAIGIWCAGALRSGLGGDEMRMIRASSPSGDWRPIRGALELVAVLQVNTGAYPVRRSRVASGGDNDGQILALVASAGMPSTPDAKLARELRSLAARVSQHDRLLQPLLPVAAERIAASI